MAEIIRISTQSLGQDRDSIEAEIEGIDKAVDELSQEMRALGQTWEGPAWQAFQTQVASDIETMQDIYIKLSGFLNHIEYAGREYRTCESNVRGIVDSI